jgi:magnesium-transporting ATPase (P-type)
VVRGDLVLLSKGDRVPADATLIEARELQTDESLLTGESVPVRKRAGSVENEPAARPGGDDLPHVYSGTLVVRGQGLAEVRATGPRSEIGQIGQTLGGIETAPPRLTRQTARLVRAAAVFGLFCCLLVFLLYGLLRGSWLNALLAGIALGMSMLPEEFPLVLTVFMVMGAWRISQARVLTRRAAAIETLGEATVLCTDKTGTLTENRMSVVALHAAGEALAVTDATALNPAFRRLVTVGALASAPDPLRPSVPAAIRECRAAGIRVAMITGDYPITAQAIARQAGLDADSVLDGPSIANMSDAELEAEVQRASIFARIVPAQKLRIVQALEAHGDVVAMTGDGVNDAPSLKAADIGIAMGGRGTDVAREAASLVLLDDDFGSIVRTIRLGRRIYDNLRKAMAYIIAVHVPIAGLALLPLLTGMPLIFGPVHIAFLEMIIDPVCSMVFEAEPAEADIMARPPRAATSTLFSPALVAWSLLQGAIALVPLAALYIFALHRGLP